MTDAKSLAEELRTTRKQLASAERTIESVLQRNREELRVIHRDHQLAFDLLHQDPKYVDCEMNLQLLCLGAQLLLNEQELWVPPGVLSGEIEVGSPWPEDFKIKEFQVVSVCPTLLHHLLWFLMDEEGNLRGNITDEELKAEPKEIVEVDKNYSKQVLVDNLIWTVLNLCRNGLADAEKDGQELFPTLREFPDHRLMLGLTKHERGIVHYTPETILRAFAEDLKAVQEVLGVFRSARERYESGRRQELSESIRVLLNV
ncbi:MAG: hypothetical protein ACE361_12160 [Aureliella sp.]